MLFYKKSESGRTMVEIIGVLVMIGILTVSSLSLYGRAIGKLHANDLIDAVRTRTLVAKKKGSLATRGMFDRREKGAVYTTAYGYGLAADRSEIYQNTSNGTMEVPVGAIHGGKGITKAMCRELMNKLKTEESENIGVGDVVSLYVLSSDPIPEEGNINCKASREELDCNKVIPDENGQEIDAPVPAVICIGIKS